MEFQITPGAKQLILNRGCKIIVSIERQECCSCAGEVVIPYLSAIVGKPNDSQIDEYEVVSADGIKVYVHNGFKKFDISSSVFVIDLDDSHLKSELSETLVMYGVVPGR